MAASKTGKLQMKAAARTNFSKFVAESVIGLHEVSEDDPAEDVHCLCALLSIFV